MKLLLIDNYDSYTYNLYQQIALLSGRAPSVAYNDRITLADIAREGFSAIVISPGPGHPKRPRDFGVCREVLRSLDLPVLGVCLGHQGLASCYGAEIGRAPEVMHGRASPILHDGAGLFRGIPQRFSAIRYHSLAILGELPAELERIAWTPEGVIMGIRHRTRPLWGVQFHPESIGTQHGDRLIENFLRLCEGRPPIPPAPFPPISGERGSGTVLPGEPPLSPEIGGKGPGDRGPQVWSKKLPIPVDPEAAFAALYAEEPHSFWLDSASASSGMGRFSFMGAAGGPMSMIVSYRTESGVLTVTRSGEESRSTESIFDFLARELAPRAHGGDALPFEFTGGFVGYFGYELKAECGSRAAHRAALPDASFIFADRMVVFDHADGAVYLTALGRAGDSEAAFAWFDATEARLCRLAPPPPFEPTRAPGERTFRLRRPSSAYLTEIAACLAEIQRGESYEICLTNQIDTAPIARPLDVYRALRTRNPAPMAAYLRLGEAAILSSSPERFLRIGRDRWVTSEPIKGTSARGRDPDEDARARRALAESEKDRAENLMIVDLCRNDLGKVCEIGTVSAPSLMRVSSYATVHQLVSTIRGRLRDDVDVVDGIRAAFPGGSMTGAPKLRTMEIIDRLEGGPRGVYSGALGYLGVGGAVDLSIVIRTIVTTEQGASIGVGGAVVALSHAERELDEMRLKGKALVEAIVATEGGDALSARIV